MNARRRLFTAPFVVTAVLGGCGKDSATSARTHDARTRMPIDATSPVPIDAAVAAAPPDAPVGPITYEDPHCVVGNKAVTCPDDMLPVAGAGSLVRRDGTWCYAYPPPEVGVGRVRCPDAGPTVVLSDQSEKRDGGTVAFSLPEMACKISWPMDCPPPEVATCNPPMPQVVTCPDALMPRLIAVAPTRREAGACFWNDLQVFCPEPQQPPPDEQSKLPAAPADALVVMTSGRCYIATTRAAVACPKGGATVILPDPRALGMVALRERELACYTKSAPCPPRKDRTCNPPPPRKVECPPQLLPTLSGGLEPTARSDGKCFWKTYQVKCP